MRYKEEKKEHGNTNESIKEKVSGNSYHSPDDKKTEQKIAEQYNVSPKTVRNAEKIAEQTQVKRGKPGDFRVKYTKFVHHIIMN